MSPNKHPMFRLLSIGLAVFLVMALTALVWAVTRPALVPEADPSTTTPLSAVADVVDTVSPLPTITDSFEMGYPGQPTDSPIIPTEAKPTATVGELPTAEPWLIPYSTDSTDKWEVFEDPTVGLRFRVPLKGAVQVYDETGTKPAWKRIIVTIAVSNAGSGYADGRVMVEIHVRPNGEHLALSDALRAMGTHYGTIEQVLPSKEPGKYPEPLVGAVEHLDAASEGSAALIREPSGDTRMLMVVDPQRIYVLGYGVEEGLVATDLEVRAFALLVESLEFIR